MLDHPIIGYSLLAAVESEYIKRIYLYSDLEEKAYAVATELYPDDGELRILKADDDLPSPPPRGKVLRIIPAEGEIVSSISKTFYKYILNDVPGLREFKGDWENPDDRDSYLREVPEARELAVAFTGNDQPLCVASDLDRMIESFRPDRIDGLIGYTRKDALDEYLAKVGIGIEEFHYTHRKNDFFNGEWMRHNCFFVLKWAKIDTEEFPYRH
jgi:hypothetical protein